MELNKKCATISNPHLRGQVLGMINQIDMIISDRQQREVKQDLDEFDDSLSIG